MGVFAVCSLRFEGFGTGYHRDCVMWTARHLFRPCSFIEDVRNGIFVESGNVEQLAAALRKLMEDDDCLHKKAMQAKKNTPWYKMEDIARQWKSLFGQLMSEEHHFETTLR